MKVSHRKVETRRPEAGYKYQTVSQHSRWKKASRVSWVSACRILTWCSLSNSELTSGKTSVKPLHAAMASSHVHRCFSALLGFAVDKTYLDICTWWWLKSYRYMWPVIFRLCPHSECRLLPAQPFQELWIPCAANEEDACLLYAFSIFPSCFSYYFPVLRS